MSSVPRRQPKVQLRFRTADRDLTLGIGEVLVLDSNVTHRVEALDDAALLLTLS